MISMRISLRSFVLVAIQLVCIGILLMTTRYTEMSPVSALVCFAGFILALWSMATMKFSNVRIQPEVKDNAQLVQTGPYRIIRHPMYTSIFLTLIPIVVDDFSWFRLGVLLVLFTNQLIKLNYEEKLLKERFHEYAGYCKRTYRLVPFVY
jgi:protein-S-isoprenylcysteine O-methyltransferase Ste14